MRNFDRGRILQFLRFCAVGGVGFVVDAGVLMLAVHLFGIDPIVGRLLSFGVAVFATFELNRRWAFKNGSIKPYWTALSGYLGVQGIGFGCNFGIYASLCLALPPRHDDPLLVLAYLAAASAVALLVNYAGVNLFVFRGGQTSKHS